MMMSVWRQGQPAVQLDHREILKVVDSHHDLALIRLCMRTRHLCLIAMDDAPAVIKPPELATFAGLYDDCYTVADLQRTERRGVDTPEEAVNDTYRVTIDFQYQDAFVLSVRLRAENHGAARARFRALIESDTVFPPITCLTSLPLGRGGSGSEPSAAGRQTRRRFSLHGITWPGRCMRGGPPKPCRSPA